MVERAVNQQPGNLRRVGVGAEHVLVEPLPVIKVVTGVRQLGLGKQGRGETSKDEDRRFNQLPARLRSSQDTILIVSSKSAEEYFVEGGPP